MIRSPFARVALLLALAGATPGLAAPSLVSSVPAANMVVAKPSRIDIHLSEKVAAQGAAIELTMTAMPGMTHHAPMKIAGFKTEVAADGKTIVAALPRPLPAGTYLVVWKAGGSQGQYAFSVK
jgi:copper resistance protein C